MEHDHTASKGERKSAAPSVRKDAASHVPSDARAVFDLQQAAGNRAVAKMLTGLGGGAKVQRSPTDPPASRSSLVPVTVQRHGFDTALGDVTDKSALDGDYLKSLATALVKVTQRPSTKEDTPGDKAEKKKTKEEAKDPTSTTEPVNLETPSRKNLDKRKETLRQATSKEGMDLKREDRELAAQEKRAAEQEKLRMLQEKKDKRARPKTEDEKNADMEEETTRSQTAKLEAEEKEQTEAEALRKREQDVTTELSPQAKANKAKKEELDKLETEKKAREDQEAREKKLKTPLTPEELADRDKKEDLDEEEEKQKDEAARRKYMRKLQKPKMTADQVGSLYKKL
jgi:hypothetical protein